MVVHITSLILAYFDALERHHREPNKKEITIRLYEELGVIFVLWPLFLVTLSMCILYMKFLEDRTITFNFDKKEDKDV